MAGFFFMPFLGHKNILKNFWKAIDFVALKGYNKVARKGNTRNRNQRKKEKKMTVQTLLERTIAELKAAGLEPFYINGCHENHTDIPEGLQINVRETFRMNNARTLENVTVTIELTDWWTYELVPGKMTASGKHIANIKVPKDASDRVIKNRVQKVLEYYNK